MGGFVKGIVTGLVSFVLGFAVLSVVMPVAPVDGPANAPANAPTNALVPAPDSLAPAPDRLTPFPASDEAAEETLVTPSTGMSSAAADGSGLPSTEPEPVSASPAIPPQATSVEPPAESPEPAAEPAPADALSGEGTVPVAETAPTIPAQTEPAEAADMGDAAEDRPAETGGVASVETSAEAAPAAPEPTPEAEPTPEPVAEPAPETTALTEVSPVNTAPVESESTPVEAPAQTPTEAPDGLSADLTPADLTPADPAPVDDAPGPAPEPALDPFPARSTPDSEPLLEGGAVPQSDPPRVQPMPSSAPGIAVRRGGEDSVGRLPTLGSSESETPANQDPEPAAAPDPDLPAVGRNAAIAVLPEGSEPLGVIITDFPATPEAETAILAFPVPVTVALDPYDPDAPRRARIYRAAGHEIALRAAALPALARPSDLAVTLDAWQRAFPQAVAFVDVPINGLGANALLAREFAGMIQPAGYGVISLRDGLDAFLQAGRAAGLATAPVFRMLDDEGQNEFTIRRLLDRAAFEALRQSGILVAGSAANHDTMSELADFARGQGRAGVALVPASAVLTRR